MLHAIGRLAVTQVQSLRRGFLQDGACPCSSVLTVPATVDRLSQTGGETYDRLCTPVGTLWTFLRQIPSDAPPAVRQWRVSVRHASPKARRRVRRSPVGTARRASVWPHRCSTA